LNREELQGLEKYLKNRVGGENKHPIYIWNFKLLSTEEDKLVVEIQNPLRSNFYEKHFIFYDADSLKSYETCFKKKTNETEIYFFLQFSGNLYIC
jgi:hypothetical protein